MTAAVNWEQLNGDYLAEGIAWLHATLEAPADGSPPADDDWWLDPRFSQAECPPALEILAARLQLSRFETQLLLLCVAMELDPSIPQLCAAAGAGCPAPTFALALHMLPQPSWDVVSPHAPLRAWRLLTLAHTPDRPLTQRALQVDERIVNYAKGLNDIDERLVHSLRLLTNPWGQDLVPSHEAAVTTILRAWDDPAIDLQLPLVELIGPDPRVRRALAAAATGRAGLELFELPTPRPTTDRDDLAGFITLLNRESRLLPLAYYLDLAELPPDRYPDITTLCRGLTAPFILGCREPWAQHERRTRLIDAARPSVAEQEQIWRDLLGPDSLQLAATLADHFDLDPSTIRDCASQRDPSTTSNADHHTPAREHPALGNSHDVTTPADRTIAQQIWDACCSQTRPHLAVLAKRIEPQVTWDDLILAPAELDALHQLADQVRGRPTVLRRWGLQQHHDRGSGVVALFAGQSGCGKTLAAEVLANDLSLTLYRIDLAGVISKYIGETERNLRSVFDAAEQGGALLFFDEADALFGKRSEVRDSHDRYANIEVNYLLQRIEEYRGVAILATNQRHALDGAFMRRLRMVINFPFPSARERHHLWRRAFPALAPSQRLDFTRLAELPATGGMIRNIALNAASCAAGRGVDIDMAIVFAMARMEFRKLNLPLGDVHFSEEKSA